MSSRLYKYVGASYLDKVLTSEDGITLKCSFPRDFNDPYELFLTVNFDDRPDVLAFYLEVVGRIPQIPTTCFSLTPVVLPLWAHYAENLQGVVIEVDESILAKTFSDCGFGTVDYQDSSHEDLDDMLVRAHEIGKPRYLYLLDRGVFSAAYFTKATCWSYEVERRMLVDPATIRAVDSNMLLDVPKQCVSALLCGPRATEETRQIVRAKARDLGCRYYGLRVSRIRSVPYFVDESNNSCEWTSKGIVRAKNQCAVCQEPLKARQKLCSWCAMTDKHKQDAASRNILRAFADAGFLDDYYRDMDAISRGRTKKP